MADCGYDPERENGARVRSDDWCRALGWQDQLLEEALAENRRRSDRAGERAERD